MKWNLIYRIYEALAVVVVLGVGWLWWSEPTIDSGNYWSSYNALLEQRIQRATLAAHQLDSTLRADVKAQGNPKWGMYRIQRAQLLQRRTNQVMATLETIKKQLKSFPKSTQRQTSRLMIDKAAAYRIKDSLDSYVDWLNNDFKDLTTSKFKQLANYDPSRDWYYPWESIQDFPKRYYQYARPAEAVAILSTQQTEIKRYETNLLQRFIGQNLDTDCGFVRIEPAIFAPLSAIQIGDEYAADMFIGTSKYNTRMTYNGRSITVKDGKGVVLFTAQGNGKQSWEGKFIYRNRSNLKDTVITYTMPFEVR